MKVIVRTAVAATLALGGASGAYAIGVPNTNSSDLILVVENLSTQAAYALDTGISINSVFPTSGVVAGTVLGTSIAGITTTIAESSTLKAFLAANPVAGDGYTIEASQYNGGGTLNSTNANSNAIGAAKMIFSSALGTAQNAAVNTFSLGQLTEFGTGLNQSISPIGTGELSGLTTATEVTGSGANPIYPLGASEKYGIFGAPDLESVGTADELFAFTGNGHANVINSYILGTVNLSSGGVLSITGNSSTGTPPPVPLPAAVWLFGSGLLGLVGVSRRRKAAAATA